MHPSDSAHLTGVPAAQTLQVTDAFGNTVTGAAVAWSAFGAGTSLEHDLRGAEDRHERAVRHALFVECVRTHLTIVPIPSSVKISSSTE